MKKFISKINRDYQKIAKMIVEVFSSFKRHLSFAVKVNRKMQSVNQDPTRPAEFNSWLNKIMRKEKPYRKQIGWMGFRIFCAFIIVVGGMFLSSRHSEAASSAAAVVGTTGTIANTGEKIYFDSGTYHSNVTIDNYTRQMAGYAWSGDLGWISFGSDSNPSGPVVADTSGHLSGKAKVVNGSYIDFNASPTGANVVIATGGNFSGYAWSEDFGWVNFSGVTSADYNAVAPAMPNTGVADSSSNTALWYIVITAGILAVSLVFYFVRRKQTN